MKDKFRFSLNIVNRYTYELTEKTFYSTQEYAERRFHEYRVLRFLGLVAVRLTRHHYNTEIDCYE